LKERIERLERIPATVRGPSGLPVALVLRPGVSRAKVKTIDAVKALARHGLTLLRAKRAIEAMLHDGEVAVEVRLESEPFDHGFLALDDDLRGAGVEVVRIATRSIDVKALRHDLGMSQEQFALRYNLDLDAVQNWEQGRRAPERAVLSYLRVIKADPKTAARAQEEGVA